ncbi:unnamed protein product [Effrenium voratum]|nr:unnamed protein product [Effrenium voratum]
MSCWRGVCRACRGRYIEAPEAVPPPSAPLSPSRVRTFDAAPPSASYAWVDQIERQETLAEMKSRQPPEDLGDDLEKFRMHVEQAQKEKDEAKAAAQMGPRIAPGLFDLITVEEGHGHRKPQVRGKVKIRYAVVLQEDASILDAKDEFEYVLGQQLGAGEVLSSLLDGMLQQMRRGQVASLTHPLKEFFPPQAPAIARHGPDSLAVCEVALLEIYVTKDCSFAKDAGEVVKEVVKDGVGDWCNNPSDEGMAVLRIEQVVTSEGAKLFDTPLEQCVTVGDGQVCDALECAVLEMRPHETALVTCRDVSFLAGGLPFGDQPLPRAKSYTIRVTLLDFNPGPDAASFDEEDRLTFALRRKAEANRLFKEARFRLSRRRYRDITELFHHLDRPKVKDRFLGKLDLFQECRKLRLECRLNSAACSVKLQDPKAAREACDLVLHQMPENTKALYRRAQAYMLQRDFAEASKDLRRLLEIDPSIQEASRLLEKAVRQRKDVDQKQKGALKYDAMVGRLADDRSEKYTYLTADMDV